jgi:hypothetical protein
MSGQNVEINNQPALITILLQHSKTMLEQMFSAVLDNKRNNVSEFFADVLTIALIAIITGYLITTVCIQLKELYIWAKKNCKKQDKGRVIEQNSKKDSQSESDSDGSSDSE